MGQYRFYVNVATQLLFGLYLDNGFSFEIHIGFLIIGLGLTSGAKGVGFWKR